MSYGVFNWWWGEDDYFPTNDWEGLTVETIEDGMSDTGAMAQIKGSNGDLAYDNRVYVLGDTEKIKKTFGKTDWNNLVESHPDVAKQMQEQPVLIYYQEEYGVNVIRPLNLTIDEFKELFVFWEDYAWWILKSPTLNRIVGRILKKNSPEKMAEFADSMKGVKA